MAACDVGGGLADMYEVAEGSAEGTAALYKKHLYSINCPSWQRSDEVKKASNTGHLRCLTYAAFITDSGGDEDGFKRRVLIESETDMTFFVVIAPCLLHLYHLMVARSLKMSDKVVQVFADISNSKSRKYFSALVKIAHVWRDYRKPIFEAWQMKFDIHEANRCTKKAPPRALSGRWGTSEQAEAYVLTPDHNHLREIFPVIVARSVAEQYVPHSTFGMLDNQKKHKKKS